MTTTAPARIQVSKFSSWLERRGCSFDATAATIFAGAGTSGLGLFARANVEAGSMFAIIPKHATLRQSQLPDFSIDGRPRGDGSILPLAVRSIVRGSEAEQAWWELAVVVALHRSVPLEKLAECLLLDDVTAAKAKRDEDGKKSQQTVIREKLRDFSGYLDFLPPVSPQQALADNEAELRKLPPSVRSDFEYMRNNNIVKSAQLVRDIPLLSKATASATSCVTPEAMLWSFEMVQSRANNFSFLNTTTELRPYGLTSRYIQGQEPTLCPVFDIMNHVRDTNVIVADTLVHAGAQQDAEEEAAKKKAEVEKQKLDDEEQAAINSICCDEEPAVVKPKPEEGKHEGLQTFQKDDYVPSIIIGALRDIKKGEEIGYGYAATPDVASSLSRWGFAPNTTNH